MMKKGTLKPIRTTLLGGAAFLVPVVFLVMLLTKALEIMSLLAKPLAGWFPLDTVGGFAVANLITILLLVLVCFGAGVLARRTIGRRFSASMESKVHLLFPRYAVLKGMTHFLREEDVDSLKVVLARFDDNAQIAFEMERTTQGLVTLFLPGAPDPWAGAVIHMAAERVTPLDMDLRAAIRSLQGMGKGAGPILEAKKISLDEAG